MTLSGQHAPHPAPNHGVPQRTCPSCGRVTGFNLSAHCPICTRPFVAEPHDRYSAEAVEQRERECRGQRSGLNSEL